MTLTSSVVAPVASPEPTPAGPTLREVVRRHRGGLIASAVLGVVAGACSLAPYVAVYAVAVALFDRDGGGSGALTPIAIWTAVAIVVRALAAGASTHVGHLAAYDILADLRLELAAAMRRLPLGRVQARSAGETKKLLQDDVEQLEEALAHGVPDMSAAAAVPLSTTVLLIAVDWRLGLIALGTLVLLVVISGVGMKLASGSSAALAEHANVMNTAVLGYLQGIKVIRGFLRPDTGYDQAIAAIERGEELNRASTHSPLRFVVSLMTVATGLAVLVLIPVAGALFISGSIGLPTLALFLLLALGYLSPLLGLVGLIATAMYRIQFAAGAVTALLAEPALTPASSPSTPASPAGERGLEVDFDAVTFSYAGERRVISDLTLRVPAGSRTALVGPTGAGKSTLARLIARFWDVDGGAVRLGGTDVRSVDQVDLARLVAFVQQDEYVFAASLRENIRIARPGASDAEVAEAARRAQLAEVAEQVGWDTALPAGGGTLSGGQRQRISIARALLKDAPVVVLDEATASLDAETEALTLAAIGEVTTGRTVIAIAHRLATIRDADQIAYLDGGRLVDLGPHAALLERCAGYAGLWEAYTAATGWHLGAAPTDSIPAKATPASERPAVEPSTPPSDRAAGLRATVEQAVAIVDPSVGEQRFARQWVTLLGNGWSPLKRQAVPRLLLEGLVRSAPLAAVFWILNAAIGQVVDGEPLTLTLVWQVTGLLILALVVRFFLNAWANASVWDIAGRAKSDLMISVIERLRRVPLGFFSRFDNGRVTTLVTNDTVMLDFQNVPQMVMGALLQPVYVTLVLLVIDWRLALAALIGLPLYWLLTAWSDRIYHRVFARLHEVRRDTTTVLIEQSKGAAVLRGNPDSLISRRFGHAVEELRTVSIAASVKNAPAIALASIAIESGLVALIAIGGALYAAGSISATTLLLFLMLALVLYQPIQELGALSGYRHNQQQIAAKLGEVWAAPVLSEPAEPATAVDASVEFREVEFAYDDAPVLQGATFHVEPGTITALVGPSGSGKSTVANLAARLWDVDAGSVRIGGADVRELGSEKVMGLVTTVYQDVLLFADTVRFNIALGRPDASDDEVWAALAAAQVDDVVRALPDGLDTVLDEGGASLSGGQRQRLSIARALMKDSPVLILDEAVASVDPDTEARIQEAIGRLAAGRTVLVIAHRLETVQNVDQILEVRDGKVRRLK